MLTLGQIENSEYNLLGAMSEDDFLQALELSGANDKRKLFRKMQNQSRAVCPRVPAVRGRRTARATTCSARNT